jgi:hypothetical protein
MTRKMAGIDDAVLSADAATSRAGSAALRRVRSLERTAPMGRAFSSIATLCELTERVESHLVSGHDALSAGATSVAISEFNRATALANGTIIEAQPDPAEREPAPKYLIQRR